MGCTNFCLKYRSPLATTARPDEANTGSRRNCTALLAIEVMLQEGGGGGDSDIIEEQMIDNMLDEEWRSVSEKRARQPQERRRLRGVASNHFCGGQMDEGEG